MNMRGLITLGWAGVFGLVVLFSLTTTAAERPNIILCMADDQGWGDVGFRNPDLHTPVLDRLAATTLRLDRFYAAAPVCSPTRGSVMTGRHPNRFGCFAWGYPLRPQEVTIAEALKQAGYATGHFGKWHLGSMEADSPTSPGGSGFDEWVSSPNFFDNNPLMSHRGKVVQLQGESSMVTVEAALPFIRRCAASKQPFLAVIWFGSPHGPHQATDELRALYKNHPERLQHFYGELTGIDRAMGRLLDEMRQLDIVHNTLLWYTSDNGALKVGSTGGLRGNKGNLYEGGIREPCMIQWPARIKGPRVSQVPCGTVDIYPTLLDIAGVKVEGQPPLDGVSLLPLIDGRMERRDKPLGFWVYPARGIPMRSTAILQAMRERVEGSRTDVEAGPSEAGAITKQYPLDRLPGHSAWIDGNLKLHRIASRQGEVKLELYDLAIDPAEKENVADAQPQRVRQMRAQLEAWQRSVIRSLNGEDYRQAGG